MWGRTRIQVHSTRLFPKFQGADAYRLSGIAARCDWILLSDPGSQGERVSLHKRTDGHPDTVFLSLRSPFAALAAFHQDILPGLERPVVLLSGSEDVTVPRQLDRRWRAFDATEQGMIEDILADARVAHWFMENRDTRLEGTSSLPVGMVMEDSGTDRLKVPRSARPLATRPLRAFCAHRIRRGEQWDTRRRVTALCRGPWAAFVDHVEDEIPPAEFVRRLRSVPFVVCVEGGGLDPSPKAWLALLQGSIPIVRSTALDDAYGLLPVATVRDWTPDALSPEILAAWRDRFAPWFDDAERRAELIRRLSLDFWWNRVTAQLTHCRSTP